MSENGSDLQRLVRTLLFAACIVAAPVTSASRAANKGDTATVVNGNTLIIGTKQLYLRGVDAPETDQYCRVGRVKWACGKQAARELANKINGGPVVCRIREGDDADCYGAGVNLGAWMISNGWATASNRDKLYKREEQTAKSARRGIWRSEFVPPWSWRRGLRASTSAINSEARACPIKGDVSPSGARLYYLPENRAYDRVKVDTHNNERWFCSIQQAERAGWRAPRR